MGANGINSHNFISEGVGSPNGDNNVGQMGDRKVSQGKQGIDPQIKNTLTKQMSLHEGAQNRNVQRRVSPAEKTTTTKVLDDIEAKLRNKSLSPQARTELLKTQKELIQFAMEDNSNVDIANTIDLFKPDKSLFGNSKKILSTVGSPLSIMPMLDQSNEKLANTTIQSYSNFITYNDSFDKKQENFIASIEQEFSTIGKSVLECNAIKTKSGEPLTLEEFREHGFDNVDWTKLIDAGLSFNEIKSLRNLLYSSVLTYSIQDQNIFPSELSGILNLESKSLLDNYSAPTFSKKFDETINKLSILIKREGAGKHEQKIFSEALKHTINQANALINAMNTKPNFKERFPNCINDMIRITNEATTKFPAIHNSTF